MISIEAYRAAIGRFYGKAKKKDRFQSFNNFDMTILKRLDMTFIIVMVLFLISVTPLLIVIGIESYSICMEYIACIKLFCSLTLTYCYTLVVVCTCTDLLALTFQKKANRDVLMQKPSRMQDRKDQKAFEPLVVYKYKDTIIPDGRDMKRNVVEMKLCMGNEANFWLIDEKPVTIKSFLTICGMMKKNSILCLSLACLGILTISTMMMKKLTRLLFYIYVGCTVIFCSFYAYLGYFVMIMQIYSFTSHHDYFPHYMGYVNNTVNNLELYCLNHLKLLQLIIDGYSRWKKQT